MRFSPNVKKPDMTEDAIKNVINQILNDLSHDNIVENMELVTGKRVMALSLLLRGDQAADVSYFFAQVVRKYLSSGVESAFGLGTQ